MELTIVYLERAKNENGFFQTQKHEVKTKKQAYALRDMLLKFDEKMEVQITSGKGYSLNIEKYRN